MNTPPGQLPVVTSTLTRRLIDEAERAEHAGRREIARRRYESALYLLGPGEGATAALVIRRIARTYIGEGQLEIAVDCLHAALAASEALDDASGAAHAINWLANIHVQRGELDVAVTLYDRALEVAGRGDDPSLEAMVAQNLGTIASTRGDDEAAIRHYAQGLAIYRQLGLERQAAQLLCNMGLAYAHVEAWPSAEAAYAEALEKAAESEDTPTVLLVRVNQTEMWLARGQLTRAADTCAAVLADAIAIGDQRVIGEASKLRGAVARRQGRLAESERYLRLAYENAMQREDLLLAAETAREQAELYEVEGRSRETLQALVLSHRLFTQLRAARELANLQRRVARLEARFQDVVRRWAETIESKDPYTRGHSDRVADYACALAREVGFDEITMFWFRMGALLHDVGKVVVPGEVLNKPGRLTDDERALIEQHPAAGVDLLRDIEFPWDILPMIRGHHERWDGKGYPDRLAGEAIPRSARVLCVADVYDALTTDRPYRKAFSRSEALAMMAADSGKLFDPELFEAFERMLLREAAVPAYAPPIGVPELAG